MKIEVVYALPNEQTVKQLELAEGATAMDAVNKSGILEQYPEIKALELKLGIFSKICEPDYALSDGERVEIYRPLAADPKEIRKRRAAEIAAKKAAEKELKAAAKAEGSD